MRAYSSGVRGSQAAALGLLWPVRQTVYDRQKKKDRRSRGGAPVRYGKRHVPCVSNDGMPNTACDCRLCGFCLQRRGQAGAAGIAGLAAVFGCDAARAGRRDRRGESRAQAADYSVDIDFYPWARAVHLTESANEYDGIFPIYYSAVRARWLNCSSSIGRSPLGFAERSKAPVAWSTLADLRAYKIGVVRDYVNTEDFDSMVASGRIAVDAANSDAQNLQKLAHGRIDLAVIDRNVLEQLMKGPAADAQSLSGLQFNSHVLENKEFYICFKRNDAGDRIAAAFAAGLRKIDVEAITARYLRALADPPESTR